MCYWASDVGNLQKRKDGDTGVQRAKPYEAEAVNLIVTEPEISHRIPSGQQLNKMLSRTAIRASKAPSMIASRGFRTSAARLSSPYHYPEGPRSNIPFNPLTKYFALRYWGTMAFFFGLPFGVAVWQTKKNK